MREPLPDPDEPPEFPAIKLFLQVEYDAREGHLEPADLEARARALDPIVRPVLRLVDAAAGERILDAGCGAGLFGLTLARANPGLEVLGIDLSEHAVASARRVAHGWGLVNARFRVADFEAVPCSDGAFDAIVCAMAFNLCPNKRDALAEWGRALRAGGRLVVFDSLRPGSRAAGTGPTDVRALACDHGFEVAADVELSAEVKLAAVEGAWPWAARVDPDARFHAIAMRRRSQRSP